MGRGRSRSSLQQRVRLEVGLVDLFCSGFIDHLAVDRRYLDLFPSNVPGTLQDIVLRVVVAEEQL